jgi:single-stranded-DNA-specific exonuclease
VSDIIAYLDFVAVAIAADIVPMVGENRTLAFLGLQQLNAHPRPGLKALMRDKPTAQIISDVVFGMAPRINAAGRMKHGLHAVELLLSATDEEAQKRGQEVEIYNTSRREVEQEITKEALAQITENQEENNAANVVYAPHWHKGVIGIVASRLIESYYRPTLVFTKSKEGILAASARSVEALMCIRQSMLVVDISFNLAGINTPQGLPLRKKTTKPLRRHLKHRLLKH